MVKKVTIESKSILLNDFFKVYEARLRYERRDGTMSKVIRRLNFERGDSVAVLIFNPVRRSVVLTNQFKYPTHEKGPGWITETVAGMIESGESPEEAARREVFEEVGYHVSKMEHISTFYVSPGGSSERIVLYYARVELEERIGSGGGIEGEGEDIETLELDLERALEQVSNGHIVDAKTILSLYWLRDYLKQSPQG